MKTIQQLIGAVHVAVAAEGMDLSPSDVGHIVSLFLEGMIHADNSQPGVNAVLQRIADECSTVQDEG